MFSIPSVCSQVIYALNTKNDEHEAAIATLKEAHEEEVQQILSETREKILQVSSVSLSLLFHFQCRCSRRNHFAEERPYRSALIPSGPLS